MTSFRVLGGWVCLGAGVTALASCGSEGTTLTGGASGGYGAAPTGGVVGTGSFGTGSFGTGGALGSGGLGGWGTGGLASGGGGLGGAPAGGAPTGGDATGGVPSGGVATGGWGTGGDATGGTGTGGVVTGGTQTGGAGTGGAGTGGAATGGAATGGAATGGAATGGAATGGAATTPAYVIDNLDDCDSAINPAEGRMGYWYAFNSTCDGLAGTQAPAPAPCGGGTAPPFTMTPDAGGGCIAQTTGSGFPYSEAEGYGSAGIGFDLRPAAAAFNACGYTGIRVNVTGDELRMKLVAATTTNGNDVGVDLGSGAHTVCFDSLKSEDWGPGVNFSCAQLRGIQFQAIDPTSFTFAVDDIEFVAGACTSDYVGPERLIDDMDDCDNVTNPVGGRLGYWYSYNSACTTAGTQTPAAVCTGTAPPFPMQTDPAGGCRAQTSGSGFPASGYAGIGFDLIDGGGTVDACAYDGIKVTVTGSAVKMAVIVPGTNNNDHVATLATGINYVAWEALAPMRLPETVPFDCSAIQKIQFRPASLTSFNFTVDDIRFYNATD